MAALCQIYWRAHFSSLGSHIHLQRALSEVVGRSREVRLERMATLWLFLSLTWHTMEYTGVHATPQLVIIRGILFY